MANRLKGEKSPYLLQHGENPVDWFPWGEEAFRRAKEEDKPVFLSIGYSTCHWCHVMAHESFEDGEIAAILNRSFIAVKVDREERPDVDSVYMAVCQMMTGAGGWPLSIWMTAEKKPFFAGTYFPKYSRYGMPGLGELLLKIEALWKEQREMLLEMGEKMAASLSDQGAAREGVPEKRLLEKGVEELLARFDPRWGGFGTAPKFPTPQNLLFLLRLGQETGRKEAVAAAEKTLQAMAQGGIFDQIGGGFSRYSNDEKWLVPHFEKMLYDNALLIQAYLMAFRQRGKDFYRRIAEKTIAYVLRELRHKEGAFFCGQDADSDGVEGKYYVFTPQEIKMLLPREGTAFCHWFGITEEGNFEGKSIPNRLGKDPQEQSAALEALLPRLLAYRQERTTLHKDDKILTSWNAMMIMSLAQAGFWLEKEDYLSAGKKAMTFLEQKLQNQEGRLLLRWREGEAAHLAQLEEYAFLILAYLELYAATFDLEYLEKAVQRAGEMKELFGEREQAGYYLYGKDGEQLISRPKESYDGAMPSGNSAAAQALCLLAALTGEEEWRRERDRQLSFLAGAMEEMPSASCYGLYAMLNVVFPTAELLCVSAENAPSQEFLSFLRREKKEGLTVLFCCPANRERMKRLAPFAGEYPIPHRGEIYYLCQGQTCHAGTTDLSVLAKNLRK